MRRFTNSNSSALIKADSTIRTFFPGIETGLAAGTLTIKAGMGIFFIMLAQGIQRDLFHEVAYATTKIALNSFLHHFPINENDIRNKLVEIEKNAYETQKQKNRGMLASLFAKNEITKRFYKNAHDFFVEYCEYHPYRR